jgi:hypothetical protein
MIYQVIAYFRSPHFFYHIKDYLIHLSWHGDESLFDMIQGHMIDEVNGIQKLGFMDTFDEKQTFKALVKFMYNQKTMTCFRRVFMHKAHKYLTNPDGNRMNDDVAKVSLPRNDKD